MVLIIGGAYQGKCEVAMELYGLCADDCYNCEDEIDFSPKIINGIDKLFLNQIKNGIVPSEYVKDNLGKFSDKIIVLTDVSGGVVPTDYIMRQWREEVGRAAVVFSKNADEVYRVFCGIPTKLK